MHEYRDIDINGFGTVSGGHCEDLNISGAGKVQGAVECKSASIDGAGTIEGDLTVLEEFSCDGRGKVQGSLRAASVEVDGAMKVDGGLFAQRVDVDGSFKVVGNSEISGKLEIDGSFRTEGKLRAEALTVDGHCEARNGISAESITVSGILKSEADVQAERLCSIGVLKIAGLLNAEHVEIQPRGDSAVESIGGGSIQIRLKESGVDRVLGSFSLGTLFSGKRRHHLAANLIEADEIHLEYTDAQLVRGSRVYIGPECVIDRVEYSGELSTDANATVRERVKI